MREPNPSVLLQMFGDDTPIGAFERENYQNAMKSIDSVEAAVQAVVKYAKDYHREQEDYEKISPFGGEDIDVISTLDIARGEVPALQELPFFHGKSAAEIEGLILSELGPEGDHIRQLQNEASRYEKAFSVANGSLLQKMSDYQNNYSRTGGQDIKPPMIVNPDFDPYHDDPNLAEIPCTQEMAERRTEEARDYVTDDLTHARYEQSCNFLGKEPVAKLSETKAAAKANEISTGRSDGRFSVKEKLAQARKSLSEDSPGETQNLSKFFQRLDQEMSR